VLYLLIFLNRKMSAGSQYEIFECAKMNLLKRVQELLDVGVDVNLKDFDTGATPLHYACSNGSKQTMEVLVNRGADVNAQNDRGITPLHTLISKRYDTLALWLVRKGANLQITDRRGYSPRDLALGWFQKELDDVAAGKLTKNEQDAQAKTNPTPEPTTTAVTTPATLAPIPSQPQSLGRIPASEEVMKIYLTQSGSYKTLKILATYNAADLSRIMAEKINISPYTQYLEVCEIKKDQMRRIQTGENLFEVKSKWPLIFGQSGNETMKHCYFLVRLRTGSPEDAIQKFDAAAK